jgi:hypothetical protein
MRKLSRIALMAQVRLFVGLLTISGNLRPHRRSSRSNSNEQSILDEGFKEDEGIGIIGRRRRVRTTTKGNIVVVNEFASELLYLMRTATDMLM